MGGISDREVSRRYGIPCASVQRHRVRHIIKPARDKIAILEKVSEGARQRQELAEAAASDEPSIDQLLEAAVGTRAMVNRYNAIQGSLGRSRVRAEEDGAHTAVAAIAGQQFKGMEFGAKLYGHPGFRPAALAGQTSERTIFKIDMVFQGSGKTESFGIVDRPVINGDTHDVPPDVKDVPSPAPNQRLRRDAEGKTLGPHWSFEKIHDPPEDSTDDQQE
jgi:hypothetical protein